MRYTHEDIVELRSLITEEVATEARVRGNHLATGPYVSQTQPEVVEARLRTYMHAEVTAKDMQLAAKVRVDSLTLDAQQELSP